MVVCAPVCFTDVPSDFVTVFFESSEGSEIVIPFAVLDESLVVCTV